MPGGEVGILFWWLLFGLTHVGGSSRVVRARLVDALGLRGFKVLYSVVSMATFVPLVWVYWADRGSGAVLYVAPGWMRHVAEVLMAVALVVMVQAYATPNPLSTAVELSGRYRSEPTGVQRISRHPSMVAFIIFGLAHCLTSGRTTDLLFFGGFVVFSLASAVHQDARLRDTGPDEAREFLDRTSLVPFGAILSGRQELALGELERGALAIGIVLFVALRVFHGALFGGFA